MVWSPYDGRETKCYTPLPAPGDLVRPFGIVRKIGEHRPARRLIPLETMRRRQPRVPPLATATKHENTARTRRSAVAAAIICAGKSVGAIGHAASESNRAIAVAPNSAPSYRTPADKPMPGEDSRPPAHRPTGHYTGRDR